MKCCNAHACPVCRPELWAPKDAVTYTIAYLVNRITVAKAAYYAGSPTLRDEEYDALETSLRAYAPNHPVLSKVGTDSSFRKRP